MKKRIQQAQKYLKWQQPNQAIAELQPVLRNKQFHSWVPFHMMGIALSLKGNHKSSAKYLQKALESGSNQPETYHLLSVNHYNLEKFEEAEGFAREALDIKEDFLEAWLNLGSVYRSQAKLEEALGCYQRANQLDPKNDEVAFRIGEIYRNLGNFDKAHQLYDFALDLNKEHKKAFLAKADLYKDNGYFDEAEEYLNEARERYGEKAAVSVAQAEIYRNKGHYDKALSIYKGMLEQRPNNGLLLMNYALCLQEISRFDQSEENYRLAIEKMPENKAAISNYLMALHYNSKNSRDYIFEEHVRLGEEFAPEQFCEKAVPANTAKDKRLNIGFISGGFRRHPVGWMITGAIEQLSEENFKVFCYTNNNKHDFLTQRIYKNSDVWRSIVGFNAEVVDGLIRKDEIDILVDLSGHAQHSRLQVMAHKPAPIIVKWVGGLFNTTGLDSFDYLISDWHETPEGEEPYYTEKLIRMPDDYISYAPPAYAPDVSSLPAEENGYITFGCFNNPTKVNEEVLKWWAGIMRQVPESRLLLKSNQYDTASFRSQIKEVMQENDVSKDRLEFKGYSVHEDHLEAYNSVDIALDPWPYSGGLTTCEALYMGVPVITLPGPTFAGRHSTTHLNNAGLDEFVVGSWEEYMQKAVALAIDRERLQQVRLTLRNKIRNSPICDGKRFAAHLSVAFRKMWEQWVEGQEKGIEDWQDHIEVKQLSKVEIDAITTGPEKTPPIELNTNGDEKDESCTKKVRAEEDMEEELEIAIVEDEMNILTHVNGEQEEVKTNKQQDDVYQIETKDGVTVCTPADLDILTSYVLLEQEEWFEPELNFIRKFLQPGMKVIDAGAAFGAYSLPMAKQVGKEGAVYAFEPGTATQRHLEMSKIENKFNHLEVIGRALGEGVGEGKLKLAETPELNMVEEKEGEEAISITTLDAWWSFAGKPEIDLIKVDVNGMEPEILKGASTMFKETAPVILASIGEDGASLEALRGQLYSIGYNLFEYIPGPNLLAEHDPEAGVDSYLMNIIAIKEDRIEEFKEAGWVYDENVSFIPPKKDLWKETLSKLPWTNSLTDEWEKRVTSGQHEEYLQALNLICAAEQTEINEDDSQARSHKGAMMLEAAQKLIDLFNSGNAGISAAMTYVRVMNQLGKKAQALEMMKEMMEIANSESSSINTLLPFLLPLPEQDITEMQTDIHKWLTVRIVEAWIMIKDLSVYMSGEQELKMLTALEGNPELHDMLKNRTILQAFKRGDSINDEQYQQIFKKGDLLLTSNRSQIETKMNQQIFPDSFWKGKFSQEKAKRVVEFTEKFTSKSYSQNVLQQIIRETEERRSQAEDDNVAFFIQVHALLALKEKSLVIPELDRVIKEKGWEHKKALYAHWFERVEYRKTKEKPQVSAIIISNKFKSKTIENLKRLEQQLSGRSEVILVNNGMNDRDLEPLMKHIHTCVKLKGNSGAYLARNMGALFAKGDLLLFVDDDGIPAEGMVQAHIHAHDNNDILVSRGRYYTNDNKEPWHYNLGKKIKPAVTLLEGNAAYKAREFFKISGWGDYILFGHGGMELSYRLLELNPDMGNQVYIPSSKLFHPYFRGESHQKKKTIKQTISFYLLKELHLNFDKIMNYWPDNFSTAKYMKWKEKQYYSQYGEDIIIDNILRSSENKEGFYVDVGAFHPYLYSNTAILNKNGWRGINIDAYLPSIQKFETKRENDINIYAAISDQEEDIEVFIADNRSQLNTSSLKQKKKWEKRGVEFIKKKIPSKKLKDIFKKYRNNKDIDFLNIDVEGAELSVLKSNDWNKFRPKLVAVEIHGFNPEKVSENDVACFLMSHSYDFLTYAKPTVFFLSIECLQQKGNKIQNNP